MDGPRLPIGKRWKGKLLREVPAHHLRWLLCNYRQMDDELRQQIADELSERGDRFAMAWEVIGDLEERLTVRLATEDALTWEVAATVCDHLLLASEETREHFGLTDGARLVIPRRVGPDTDCSIN